MWNLEADDDADDVDDPFSQPERPDKEHTVKHLHDLYNQVLDSQSKEDALEIVKRQPGIQEEEEGEEESNQEELYDDEFVEEDSYELDSFEMDPSKKQETIADVSAPKVETVQRVESKTTEFGHSSQSSNQTGRFESAKNTDQQIQKQNEEAEFIERAKTETSKQLTFAKSQSVKAEQISKKRQTAKTRQIEILAPPKEKPLKNVKKRKLVITRMQRTKEDIEMENQIIRLTTQNEAYRNQLKILSAQMDDVIQERQRVILNSGPVVEKPPVDYETSLEEQLQKTKLYELSLKRQSQAQTKRIEFLNENPTYQTELLQTSIKIEQQIEEIRQKIKSAATGQRFNSQMIVRKTKLSQERREQHMVTLKNRHDQYQVVMWSLTNITEKLEKLEQQKQVHAVALSDVQARIEKESLLMKQEGIKEVEVDDDFDRQSGAASVDMDQMNDVIKKKRQIMVTKMSRATTIQTLFDSLKTKQLQAKVVGQRLQALKEDLHAIELKISNQQPQLLQNGSLFSSELPALTKERSSSVKKKQVSGSALSLDLRSVISEQSQRRSIRRTLVVSNSEQKYKTDFKI